MGTLYYPEPLYNSKFYDLGKVCSVLKHKGCTAMCAYKAEGMVTSEKRDGYSFLCLLHLQRLEEFNGVLTYLTFSEVPNMRIGSLGVNGETNPKRRANYERSTDLDVSSIPLRFPTQMKVER